MAEGVRSEVLGHGDFVESVSGVVEVHGDFLEDDIFFGVEVGGTYGGSEEVGEVFEGFFGEFREDVGVVGGHFLGGEGVISGADFVEDAVDIFPGVFFGAFEHHMFEEV